MVPDFVAEDRVLIVTTEEFEALTPFERGYAVYMLGARKDQPNVPDEPNPYSSGTHDADEWNRGVQEGVLEAQDGEDG